MEAKDILKPLIACLATGVTIFQLYFYGDGTTVTALFSLYGILLGVEVAKRAES